MKPIEHSQAKILAVRLLKAALISPQRLNPLIARVKQQVERTINRGFRRASKSHAHAILLRRGYFFTVLANDTVRVTGRRAVDKGSFDYNVFDQRKFFATFLEAGWKNADIHYTLKWGANEDADKILSFCALSSNHKTASLQPADLGAIVNREFDKCFCGDPMLHPPLVSFGVVRLHLVSKPGGKWLNVPNNTWSKDGSLHSVLHSVPIALNAYTRPSRNGAF